MSDMREFPENIPDDIAATATAAYEIARANWNSLPFAEDNDIAYALKLAMADAILAERERCAKYHDDWEQKHMRLAAGANPSDVEFHHEHALRHRVHAAAVRKPEAA